MQLQLLGGGTDLVKNNSESVASDENAENITNKKAAKNADAGKTVENIVKTPASQETTQSFSVQKNIQAVSENAVKSNLTQESNSDDWANPAKQGFHYTNAGWTWLQQGKDYTSVAKDSHTILIDENTNQELSHNNRIEVDDTAGFGIDINATIDKNDIKAGNKILISSLAFISKDNRHFVSDISSSTSKINVISNGVKIGHIEAINGDFWGWGPVTPIKTATAQDNYFLVIDQTQNMVKDLNLHIHLGHTSGIDSWGDHWHYLKGTTLNNPTQEKIIANNDTDYNYTVFADPTNKRTPQHYSDSSGYYLSQDIAYGNISFYYLSHNTDESFTSQNESLNKVYKLSRPKEIDGVAIPNFKNSNYTPRLQIQEHMPILNKDGVLDDLNTKNFYLDGVKLADGASAQQVAEAAKNKHFVYSVSDDGQSILIGINTGLSRTDLGKLVGGNYSVDDAINDLNQYIDNTRTVSIDYADQAQDIIKRSNDWVRSHNGEPFKIWCVITQLPQDTNQPNIQTVTDVTPGVKNPLSVTNHLFPKNNNLSFDASVYRQIGVKFVDDDNNENVINTDNFMTSTGTDLTYNIKKGNDPSFNSTTDIAFPGNFVLNQPSTVHYGIVQDKNKDIIIHIKHLIKTINGDTNLDLYPDIKKALNGDSTRTFHITYPEGRQGGNPSTIVQSIHFIRSGKADFSTDSVDSSTLTAWTPVANTAKGVTITNGVANFDAITLPRVAGYTAKVETSKVNPAMFLISFVANPVPNVSKADDNKTPVDQGSITIDNKGQNKIHDNGHGDITIEAPSDKSEDKEAVIPSTPSNIDVPNSKNDSGQDWQISSIKTHDYTVSNGKDEFSLPIIENRALNIIKANDQTLAFNYIKLNVPSDYVFIISKRRKMYQLSVLKQNNGKWQVVKTFKSHDYKSLMKELKKLVY